MVMQSRWLHVVRDNTENLRQLIIDEIVTWIGEHSVQKTNVVAFMSKYCRYPVYQQNFAEIILWQHHKIYRSISSLKRKCNFMLKSDIKSCPITTDTIFPG